MASTSVDPAMASAPRRVPALAGGFGVNFPACGSLEDPRDMLQVRKDGSTTSRHTH